ncbi:MAG TPA: hypothetical protein VGJ16_13580, partial [Pirellulales bacterium]
MAAVDRNPVSNPDYLSATRHSPYPRGGLDSENQLLMITNAPVIRTLDELRNYVKSTICDCNQLEIDA